MASLHPIKGDRLLTGIVVEARSRFPSEASGQDHFSKQRRRCEPLLAIFVEHDVGDEVGRVEADEIEEREWAHRIAAAELHRLVDVFDRADALFECADRVEEIRNEQAIYDE